MKLKINNIKYRIECFFKTIGVFVINLLNNLITKLNENSKIKKIYIDKVYSKKESISKKTGMILCTIIIALIFLFINPFTNRGYKAVCHDIVKGTFEANSELIVKHYPDEWLDFILTPYELNSWGQGDSPAFAKEKLISDLNLELQNDINSINNAYGEGWTYSYEITDTHDYSKDDIKETINESKNEYFEFKNFDEMKGVRMIITIKKNGEERKKLSQNIILIKRNGTWYYIN